MTKRVPQTTTSRGRVPEKSHQVKLHRICAEQAEHERLPCTVVRMLLVCTSGTTAALELDARVVQALTQTTEHLVVRNEEY